MMSKICCFHRTITPVSSKKTRINNVKNKKYPQVQVEYLASKHNIISQLNAWVGGWSQTEVHLVTRKMTQVVLFLNDATMTCRRLLTVQSKQEYEPSVTLTLDYGCRLYKIIQISCLCIVQYLTQTTETFSFSL